MFVLHVCYVQIDETAGDKSAAEKAKEAEELLANKGPGEKPVKAKGIMNLEDADDDDDDEPEVRLM